jgi:hypothetical protein
LFPVKGESKNEGGMVNSLDFTSEVDRLEVGRTERSARCLFDKADEARRLRSDAWGEPKREPPANPRGLIVRIDASNFDGIGFTSGIFPITERRDDSIFAKGRHALFFGVVLSSGTARPFSRAGFANPGKGESRIVRIELLDRVLGEFVGSVKSSSPAAVMGSSED